MSELNYSYFYTALHRYDLGWFIYNKRILDVQSNIYLSYNHLIVDLNNIYLPNLYGRDILCILIK